MIFPMSSTIAVLGACGGIGSVACQALACSDSVGAIVAADRREGELKDLASRIGDSRLSTVSVDVNDTAALVALVGQAEVLLNCVGPFYRFGAPVLEAVIEAGTNYVDVCDDLDATLAQFDLDKRARDAGVSALIGMGSSPGLANVLVRYAADHLLDTVESVDICHVHGGEPSEGPAVLKHRIHAMVNDVPVFADGALRNVRMLEPTGAEFIGEVDFREVGTFRVYPYPHPETVTLPRHLPGLKRATNRGTVFPTSYFELTMSCVRDGLASTAPLSVDGQQVVPLEFMVAHIIESRPALLAEAGVTGPSGCLRIDIGGVVDGQQHRYVFSSGSSSDGAGAGTGIPAALGALLMLQGEVAVPGVHPPEEVVNPMAMLSLAASVVGKMGVGGGEPGSGGKVPLHIEHTLPDGTVEEVEMGLGAS